MHEAEQYLRNPANPDELIVRYGGKKRRLFINDRAGDIGMIRPRCKNKGFIFTHWDGITKIYLPDPDAAEKEEARRKRSKTAVYVREARKATFTNPFIRKCLAADRSKAPYENNISTGTDIDGQLISLNAIARVAGWEVNAFRRALREKTPYNSGRFAFQGHEGTLSVEVHTEDDGYYKAGDVCGYFSKEYEGCLNGYYYLLVNDETFIGYDID